MIKSNKWRNERNVSRTVHCTWRKMYLFCHFMRKRKQYRNTHKYISIAWCMISAANRPIERRQKWQFAKRTICIQLKLNRVKMCDRWPSISHSRKEKKKKSRISLMIVIDRSTSISIVRRSIRVSLSDRLWAHEMHLCVCVSFCLFCVSFALMGTMWQVTWRPRFDEIFSHLIFSGIINEKERWYVSDRTAYISFLITHRVEMEPTANRYIDTILLATLLTRSRPCVRAPAQETERCSSKT